MISAEHGPSEARRWYWDRYYEYSLIKPDQYPDGLVIVPAKGHVEDADLGSVVIWPQMHQYEPRVNPQIPAELANLHRYNCTNDSILEFVHGWGMLGHAELTRSHRPDPAGQPSPTHSTFENEAGEPISWIKAHARNAWLVLKALVVMGDEATLAGESAKELLDDLVVPRTGVDDDWEVMFAAGLIEQQTRWVIRGGAYDTLPYDDANMMRRLLGRAVTMIISGTRNLEMDRFQYSTGAGFTYGQEFNALIEAIYWQIATAAVAQGTHGLPRYIQCDTCGRFWLKSHPRQRFCPPESGQRESRCAVIRNVERMRQLRSRQRLEAEPDGGGSAGTDKPHDSQNFGRTN